MAKVHFVKKAQKDHPEGDIKKGESYYWWDFRFGGTHYSKTPPKPSQLTQSDFLSQALSINERLETIGASEDIETIKSDVESIIDEIRSLGDECQDKLDSMPDQLRETSSAGELLQSRIDACSEWADNLESVDFDVDEETFREEAKDEVKEEIESGEELSEAEKDAKIEELVDEKTTERLNEITSEIQGFTYDGE